MKLRVLDQIAVSAVQADSLRPKQEIEVSDELGKELLAKHAKAFEQIDAPAAKPAKATKAKPAATPQNKVEPASKPPIAAKAKAKA